MLTVYTNINGSSAATDGVNLTDYFYSVDKLLYGQSK